MKRMILGLLLLAAYPALAGPLAEPLPEPPQPPARIPDRDLAPTPNRDARLTATPSAQQASVELRMFQRTPADSGFAFTPGSRFRTPEERRPIQAPGVSVTVPID